MAMTVCVYLQPKAYAGEELRYSYMDKRDDRGELFWRRVCTECCSIMYLNV